MSGRSGLQKEGFILTCDSEDKVHHSGEGMGGGAAPLQGPGSQGTKANGQKTGLDHNPPGATPVIGGHQSRPTAPQNSAHEGHLESKPQQHRCVVEVLVPLPEQSDRRWSGLNHRKELSQSREAVRT